MKPHAGRLTHFQRRLQQRCYSLEEVAGCIISQDSTTIVVDLDHAAYPKEPKPGCVGEVNSGIIVAGETPEFALGQGPGTELKKMLEAVGITSESGCKCNKRAAYMNDMGIEWCEGHRDMIIDWLREAAEERGLPFIRVAASLLLSRAIAKARRAAQNPPS